MFVIVFAENTWTERVSCTLIIQEQNNDLSAKQELWAARNSFLRLTGWAYVFQIILKKNEGEVALDWGIRGEHMVYWRVTENRSPKHKTRTLFLSELQISMFFTPWNSKSTPGMCDVLLGPERCSWWWPTPHSGRWGKGVCKLNRGISIELETRMTD